MAFIGNNPKSKSLTLTPQSSDITSPANGMLEVSDGTVREKGAYIYQDSAWTKLGASSSSGINYIANGQGTSATGWVCYQDASAVSPVDGTGGSPTVTLTVNSSSPLRGVSDLILTKDAADRRGEGVAYDFTVDIADYTKPLTVSFDYKASANFSYANADVKVFIYSKDGTALIPVTPNTLDGSGHFVGEFQTEATPNNDYRLILHVATTNAGAWTLQVDAVSVGPQAQKSFGVPATDWIAFTPTGSWSANTTYTGFWRRVGDSAEVQIKLALTGAPTAATLSVNMPSGLVIDAAKLTTGASNGLVLGTGFIVDADGLGWLKCSPLYASSTSVWIYVEKSDQVPTYLGAITETSPVTFNSPNVIQVEFKVPIAGWSSNVQLSDGAETRVVAFESALASGPTGTLAAAYNVVKFNTLNDTHAAYNSTTGLYTVPVAGWYQVNAGLYYTGTTTAAQVNYTAIYKNGAFHRETQMYIPVNGYYVFPTCTSVIKCNTGDTLACYSYTGIATPALATDSYLSIHRVSGPATIAASEKVFARYSSDAGNTYASGGTSIVDFEDRSIDSHSSTTIGAAWKFVAPSSGVYQVRAKLQFASGAWTAGDPLQLDIYKNGSQYAVVYYAKIQATITDYLVPSGSDIVSLNAGDYIDIRVTYTRTAGNLALLNNPVSNIVSIIKQ